MFPDGGITGPDYRGQVFPDGDITGPKGRDLVFPEGDNTGRNYQGLVFPDGDITGPNCRGLVFSDGDMTGPNCRGLVFPDGALQAQIPSTASDGWAPSAFDPLKYSTDNVVLFWQPSSYFSKRSLSSFVIDGVSYSCAEQFMTAEKARLFEDHRTVELIMSSPDPSTHTNASVEAYSAAWDGEKQCRVIWQLRQIHAESRHETSPFEHWQQKVGRSQPSGPSVGRWSPGG